LRVRGARPASEAVRYAKILEDGPIRKSWGGSLCLSKRKRMPVQDWGGMAERKAIPDAI